LKNNTLEEIIHFQEVTVGDTFNVPPGAIHAIGKGVVLAEIQQTSDITYRVYDWNRPDIDGNLRELHNDLALDAIDFSIDPSTLQCLDGSQENTPLVSTAYFTCHSLKISGATTRLLEYDSFVVYMCVSGEVTIQTKDGEETLHFGETALIPASCNEVLLQA